MARTTSTQRGASRRTTRTAPSGPKSRGASTARSRKPPARPRAAVSRARRPAGPWIPVLVVALVAVLGWSLYPALRLQYIASRRLATVEQQYASQTKDKAALRSEVLDLQTPKGVEEAARKGLGYAKAGEDVYIVVPAGESASGTAKGAGVSTASAAEMPPPSLLQQLLDAFFGVEQPSAVVEP
jgi:cell division protein FtsB